MRVLKRSHGRAISKKWFLKAASQVDFTLPVTIRLLPATDQHGGRQHNAQTVLTAPSAGTSLTVQSATGFVNGQSVFVFAPGGSEDSATITGITGNVITINAPLGNSHGVNDVVSSIPGGANQATLDLGPSLGVRSIGLGGYIPAQINFNDAFNGGQLGDVKLTIPSNVPSAVTTTSVPLLANTNTTSQNAPEDSIDSFIVSNTDPGNVSLAFTGFPGSTTGPVSVASIVGGSPPGGSLQSALQGVNNPVSTGTVGANGVYAYAAPYETATGPLAGPCPVGLTPQCSYVSVVFTGPKFNGTPLPALTAGAGSTAAYLVPPSQRVVGQQPGIDPNGQGGCNQFHGNGLQTLGPANDIDLLGNLNTSMDPGTASYNNLGPGPSYGGSTNPQDTVLRTGPLVASVAAPGTVSIPADNQGDRGIVAGIGTTQYTIGPSGGKANLFGTAVDGLPSGDSLDVTVNLQTTVNDIARQVDGAFPGPSGGPDETLGNINAYANCRQAWTGGIQDYLTNLHLSGALKISPAITADGHLRIAKTYLHSTRPTTETLAACLSPYQLYMQGNPFSNDSPFAPLGGPSPIGPNLLGGLAAAFNPLVELTGSALGPAAAGYQGAAVPSSVAPTVGCDSGSGPLNRAPFNVTPLHGSTSTTSPTSAADVNTSLNNGSAVAVSGALNVTNLQAEALVGNIAGG